MASIVQRPNKHKWIQWVDSASKRQTLRLGACTKRDAERHKLAVESVLSARAACHPVESEIARFLGALDGRIRERYEALGLVVPKQSIKSVTLDAYLASYFDTRTAKRSTKASWQLTRTRLNEHFGNQRAIDSITPVEARAFRAWLESTNGKTKPKEQDGRIVLPKLADNTVRRRMGICRQVFQQAVDDGILTINPFRKTGSTTVTANKKRQYYVPLEDFDKLLEHAPNDQWRALIVLARIGALRVPSEALNLTWADVSWASRRITVASPKTERHEGHESRVVPLFPVIEQYLLRLFVTEGGERVFDITTNQLANGLKAIIKRAGLKRWPRLWQNLRASGATDLARALPAHIATAICGHSAEIAMQHYWQVVDSDLESAISSIGAKHNPKQSVTESKTQESTRSTSEAKKPAEGSVSQEKSPPRESQNDYDDGLLDSPDHRM